MKEKISTQPEDIYAKVATRYSIETAVEYLIQECISIKDFKGAKILSNALEDFRRNGSTVTFDKQDEKFVIAFLRELLAMNDASRKQLADVLESLEESCDVALVQ